MHLKPRLRTELLLFKVNSSVLDKIYVDVITFSYNSIVPSLLGPPGTGKTFIGVLLAEIFLSSTSHTLLLICFTNHALDDVLESLLDVGVTGIVRLGGRSRSERLSKYNLRELGRSGKAPFSREQTRRFAQLKEEIETAKSDIERLQRVLSREIGEKWWNTVEVYLKDSDPDSYHQ